MNKEIEKAIDNYVQEQVEDALLNHSKVIEAAQKLYIQDLQGAEVSIWPNGVGFKIAICADLVLDCDVYKEIDDLVSEDWPIDTLKELKSSLMNWLTQVCNAIEEEENGG